MSTATIELRVPELIYRQLERSAAVAHRSVAEILVQTLQVALPPSPDLPELLANELAEMLWMSDDALRSATHPTMTKKEQKRLSTLNDQVDDRSLTVEEENERSELLGKYEQSMLRRAQAFAILARRGHRLPSFTELPSL